MNKSTLLIIAIGLLFTFSATAQVVGLKTNLVADATTTINVGLEIATAPKNTLDLYVNYNPWEPESGKLIKHLLVQPEYRFWFCDRFAGSFLGVHLHDGADLATIDWSSYYLDHVQATGTDIPLNSEKAVTFSSTRWWPFNPNNYLAFVAYSPYYGSNGDNRVARVGDTNTLRVTSNGTNSQRSFPLEKMRSPPP